MRALNEGGNGFNFDTAVFSDDRANYVIVLTTAIRPTFSNDIVTVTDTVAGRDGTDRLTNVERLQFADQTVSFSRERAGNAAPVGS